MGLALAVGLTACATQDDIQPTLSRVQAGHVGLQEPADSSTPFVLAEVPAWWRSLGDAQLDALVERALNDNPSLQTAAARVRQALPQVLTYLPDIGLEVAPVRGNAVFFSYNRPHPGTLTLHGGAPVLEGEKWVATKWMRERVFE